MWFRSKNDISEGHIFTNFTNLVLDDPKSLPKRIKEKKKINNSYWVPTYRTYITPHYNEKRQFNIFFDMVSNSTRVNTIKITKDSIINDSSYYCIDEIENIFFFVESPDDLQYIIELIEHYNNKLNNCFPFCYIIAENATNPIENQNYSISTSFDPRSTIISMDLFESSTDSKFFPFLMTHFMYESIEKERYDIFYDLYLLTNKMLEDNPNFRKNMGDSHSRKIFFTNFTSLGIKIESALFTSLFIEKERDENIRFFFGIIGNCEIPQISNHLQFDDIWEKGIINDRKLQEILRGFLKVKRVMEIFRNTVNLDTIRRIRVELIIPAFSSFYELVELLIEKENGIWTPSTILAHLGKYKQ